MCASRIRLLPEDPGNRLRVLVGLKSVQYGHVLGIVIYDEIGSRLLVLNTLILRIIVLAIFTCLLFWLVRMVSVFFCAKQTPT